MRPLFGLSQQLCELTTTSDRASMKPYIQLYILLTQTSDY
ncbi:hypothetical protein APA_3325 [Pseudanabaena sp. lw0831]|nr:hypothetical protein APA_3325 [Pseudanabaena sp. lw0831]